MESRNGKCCTAWMVLLHAEIAISSSGVWKEVDRPGIRRLLENQRYRRQKQLGNRYENPHSGHPGANRRKIDHSYCADHGNEVQPAHCHRGLPSQTGDTRLPLKTPENRHPVSLECLLERIPSRVELIPTKSGAEFQLGIHRNLLVRSIRHSKIKHDKPRLIGKLERQNRINSEKFYLMLDYVVIDVTDQFKDKL